MNWRRLSKPECVEMVELRDGCGRAQSYWINGQEVGVAAWVHAVASSPHRKASIMAYPARNRLKMNRLLRYPIKEGE